MKQFNLMWTCRRSIGKIRQDISLCVRNNLSRFDSIRILSNEFLFHFPRVKCFLCSSLCILVRWRLTIGHGYATFGYLYTLRRLKYHPKSNIFGNYGGISFNLCASSSLSETLYINAFGMGEPITTRCFRFFISFYYTSYLEHYTDHISFYHHKSFQMMSEIILPIIQHSKSPTFGSHHHWDWVKISNFWNSLIILVKRKQTKKREYTQLVHFHFKLPSPHENNCWNGNNKSLKPLMLMNNPRE